MAKKTSKSAKKTAKKTAKKAASKKTVKKPAAKKTAKKTTKKTTKKAPAKKPASKKTTKKAVTKKTAKKTAAKPAPKTSKATTKKTAAKAADDKKGGAGTSKSGRKGITIVEKKGSRRPSSPPKKTEFPNLGSSLLGAGKRKPLITSGPKAPKSRYSFAPGEEPTLAESKRKRKSPLNAKDLEEFRSVLFAKRSELVGDVSTMEQGALSSPDKAANNPADAAEQGSDAYDQSLSLGLAEVDRKLIAEIDDALTRIDEGSFGICEYSGQPIKLTRLRELPWTRYTIEAARELESQHGHR